MKRYVLILIVLAIASMLIAECDMMAMIAKKGYNIPWISGFADQPNLPDDPHDLFYFLEQRSSSNPDGYGVVGFDRDGNLPEIQFPQLTGDPTTHIDASGQAWYAIPDDNSGTTATIQNCPAPFNNAKNAILDSNEEFSIVLGHVRNATGDESGSHPFQLICDTDGDGNDETYSFIHNGNVSDMVETFRTEIISIDSQWFDDNHSNWEGEDDSATNWIDSEMYFHYLVANIKNSNGDIVKGIYERLNNPATYSGSTSIHSAMLDNNVNANFVLTDGNNLYLYRNCDDDDHRLSFKKLDNGITAVKTQESNGINQMGKNTFAVITPYNSTLIPIFLPSEESEEIEFVSGNLTTDLDKLRINSYMPRVYITGDCTVPGNADIDITPGTYVEFLDNATLTIDGKLNLRNGSKLDIKHSSLVTMTATPKYPAELFLDWGCTITGASTGWIEQIKPGNMYTGMEEEFPGDRIIAQNGGMITTDIPDHFDPNNDPEITIGSSSGNLWTGIYIKNPPEGTDYWFVNCNISNICDLVIKDFNYLSMDRANLRFYKSNFHDNAQLLARDGHRLFIQGDSGTPCVVQDNSMGVQVFNSPLTVDYADFTGNGTGLNLNYTCGQSSSIKHSNINNNDGNGIVFRDRQIDFRYNNVMDNTRNGVIAYSGGAFTNFIVDGVYEVSNNGWAEYSGYYTSYTWDDEANNISDDAYTYSSDRYILKHLDYNGNNPVDVSGSVNTIDQSDPTRFYPTIDAFYFGPTQIPIVKQLFTSASDDMNSGDYASAESTFEQIIVDYPESVEAAASLENLYFIENYTDKDYDTLLSYIDSVDPIVGSPLERIKRDVTTRTLMQKEDYTSAISRLETVIENPATSTELYEAQYDQAYCYVKLAEEGTRALPENCSYKPKNFAEFLRIANDLGKKIITTEESEDCTNYTEADISCNNYPNPFNPTTTINFNLPSDSDVSVEVYNVKGQKVKTLINQKMIAGNNSVVWNGDDNKGSKVSSGIYFYRVKTNQSTVMKKIMLLK